MIPRTLVTTLGLALLGLAGSATAADNTAQLESTSGVRYHTVGYDKNFNRTAAHRAAWDRAVTECDQRSGYMTEYQSGATSNIIGLAVGARETAFATCRTDFPMPTQDDLMFDDIIPEASVSSSPRLRITASGTQRTAYIAVREKAASTCSATGEHVEHMSIGFEQLPAGNLAKGGKGVRVTAFVHCAAG